MIEADLSLDRVQILGVRSILNLRFQPHQLQEPAESSRALHELLHKVDQLFDRGGEGRDI